MTSAPDDDSKLDRLIFQKFPWTDI